MKCFPYELSIIEMNTVLGLKAGRASKISPLARTTGHRPTTLSSFRFSDWQTHQRPIVYSRHRNEASLAPPETFAHGRLRTAPFDRWRMLCYHRGADYDGRRRIYEKELPLNH